MRSAALFLLASWQLGAQQGKAYDYFLTGNPGDARIEAKPAYLLAGGGKTDEATFTWWLDHAKGGDVLVLRASGADGYHPIFPKLAAIDSVETIVFKDAAAAQDPFVIERIRQADALFFAGGNQWNYVRYWKDTPVQREIQSLIDRKAPVGGTSAGLAILSEFAYDARNGGVTSKEAQADPANPKVTLTRGLLRIPYLTGCLITDSHFSQRDRMGRLLVFLDKMRAEPDCAVARAIAVDERASVRLDAGGIATVAGEGAAFFVSLGPGEPRVRKVAVAEQFDVQKWPLANTPSQK